LASANLRDFCLKGVAEMGIEEYDVIEQVFNEAENRWYVVLDRAFHGAKKWKRAIYAWLKHNPVFQFIPQGYAIHHLNQDSTDDDPSNLALMQKHQHLAYHLKNKIIRPTTSVHFNGFLRESNWEVTREPKINYIARIKRYEVTFVVKEYGVKKRLRMTKYNGSSFKTLEDAKDFVSRIWVPT
jgi:hypothetical protein